MTLVGGKLHSQIHYKVKAFRIYRSTVSAFEISSCFVYFVTEIVYYTRFIAPGIVRTFKNILIVPVVYRSRGTVLMENLYLEQKFADQLAVGNMTQEDFDRILAIYGLDDNPKSSVRPFQTSPDPRQTI